MDTLDDKHKLGIGDRLSFRIVEDLDDPLEPREPKSLVVSDSGELELPYLGRFPAEGKTSLQLARQIKAALEADYYHQATVILAIDLMAKTRGRIYVAGAVRLGGPQEIPADEIFTLSSAILRAGGFTDFADKKQVRITRRPSALGGQNTVFTADVQQIIEKGKTDSDVVLAPEDLIYVPERSIRF
jgi:protein involved in polysaccharide export with SLBB domain